MNQPPAFYERILSKYGLPTAIALFLIYWVTSDVSGTMRAMQATLNEHMSESAYYLRAICLHVSKDEAERAECVPRVGK